MLFTEAVYLFLEKVDFDSKPEFAKGTDLRKKIDEILKFIENSKYSFEGFDERYADGFIAERIKAFIANKFDSQEIADVLVKFDWLVKNYAKEIISKGYKIDLRAYPYPKLREMVNKEYDHFSNIQKQKEETRQNKTEGAKKVFETDKYEVWKIDTKEACIAKGRNTTWCISADDSINKDVQNYWDDYLEYIHYFLISKQYTEKQLNEYPKHKKPPFSKIVLSMNKNNGTFFDDSGDYEDENNDANDDEYTTEQILDKLSEIDIKLYNWLNDNFNKQTDQMLKNRLWFKSLKWSKSGDHDMILVEEFLNDPTFDVNVKDSFGQTGVYYTVKTLNPQEVELFLNNPRVKIDIRDNNGLSPFWELIERVGYIRNIAYMKDYIKIFEMFLKQKDNKIDAFYKDDVANYTPLLWFCSDLERYRDPSILVDIVKLLIKYKANLNETVEGMNVIQLLKRQRIDNVDDKNVQILCIKLLEDAGVKE
jgi:ankyrin repeat protein